MNRFWSVLVVVAVALCGCGQNPVSPNGQTDFALSGGPVSAAKPTVAENKETVVICYLFGTYPTNSEVWISRAISGRAPEWKVGRWDSKFRAVFNVSGGGYYRAMAVGPDGLKLGDEWEWNSIPIRAGKTNMFDLTVGQQAEQVVDWRVDEEVLQPQLTVLVSRTMQFLDVVAGTVGFNFAYFTFDATAAREDIVVRSFYPSLRVNTPGTVDDLSNFQLLDGSTVLGAIKGWSPDALSMERDFSFILWKGEEIRVPKGTVKTIALKCNIKLNPAGIPNESIYAFRFNGYLGNVDAVGVVSGQRVPVGVISGPGAEVRLRSHGVLKIALDSSTPISSSIKGGSVGVPTLKLKFSALYENILHSKIRIKAIGNPKAILKLTFWDEYGSKLGEGVFAGNNDYADATWNLRLLINQDGSRVVTVMADFSPVGLGYPIKSGDTVSLAWEGTEHPEETWGVGESSGAKIFSDPIPPSISNNFRGGVITLM